MNWVVDASAIIALLDPSDAHHQTAAAIFPDTDSQLRLLAHPLTIAEALVHPERGGVGQRALETMTMIGVLATDVDTGSPLRLARLWVSTRLRLPDCCVLDVAIQHRARLVTFDDLLAVAARTVGVTVLPIQP